MGLDPASAEMLGWVLIGLHVAMLLTYVIVNVRCCTRSVSRHSNTSMAPWESNVEPTPPPPVRRKSVRKSLAVRRQTVLLGETDSRSKANPLAGSSARRGTLALLGSSGSTFDDPNRVKNNPLAGMKQPRLRKSIKKEFAPVRRDTIMCLDDMMGGTEGTTGAWAANPLAGAKRLQRGVSDATPSAGATSEHAVVQVRQPEQAQALPDIEGMDDAEERRRRWRLVKQFKGTRKKSLHITAASAVMRAVQMFEHKIKDEEVIDEEQEVLEGGVVEDLEDGTALTRAVELLSAKKQTTTQKAENAFLAAARRAKAKGNGGGVGPS
jgi:hypothetical protein